jgi:hypothetical protein
VIEDPPAINSIAYHFLKHIGARSTHDVAPYQRRAIAYAWVGEDTVVEYIIYSLVAAGIVGIGGKTYFEKQLAAKAKAKRDAATANKRRSLLALEGPSAAPGRRNRRAQFGKR